MNSAPHDIPSGAKLDPLSLEWLKRAKKSDSPRGGREVQVGDIFAGVGGLSLGACSALEQAGCQPKARLVIEAVPDYLRVYQENIPLHEHAVIVSRAESVLSWKLQGPVAKKERDVVHLKGHLDLLLAGPPCQGHSNLNNRTRRLDDRNKLYLLAARAALLARPSAVVIENVQAVTRDHHRVVETASKALVAAGYHVQDFTLKGTTAGLPQTRTRHFLLASEEDLPSFQIPLQDPPAVWEYLADLEYEPARCPGHLFATPSSPQKENRERIDYLFDNGLHDLPNEFRPKCHRSNHSYKSMYGRLKKTAPAQTITSGFGSMGQGRFVHPTQRRMITPHEAARLQGFPDFFAWSKLQHRVQLQEAIGNAVPPRFSTLVVQWLLKEGAL